MSHVDKNRQLAIPVVQCQIKTTKSSFEDSFLFGGICVSHQFATDDEGSGGRPAVAAACLDDETGRTLSPRVPGDPFEKG